MIAGLTALSLLLLQVSRRSKLASNKVITTQIPVFITVTVLVALSAMQGIRVVAASAGFKHAIYASRNAPLFGSLQWTAKAGLRLNLGQQRLVMQCSSNTNSDNNSISNSNSNIVPSNNKHTSNLIICGPSGVGKGTIISALLNKYPQKLSLSVSHTSRKPRPGEVDGQHYFYVTKDFMETKIKEGSYFLESACVHGNIYGTSFEALDLINRAGKVCILDVDTRGVRSIKTATSQLNSQNASNNSNNRNHRLDVYKYLFIAPPRLETLTERLTKRGTESEEQVRVRVTNAVDELTYGRTENNFDAVVVNDDLSTAVSEVEKLLLQWFPQVQ